MTKTPEVALVFDLTQTLQIFDFNKMWAVLYDLVLEQPGSENVSFDEMQSAYGQAYGLYQRGAIKSDLEWALLLTGLLGISSAPADLNRFIERHYATRNRYITLPQGFVETLSELKTDFRLCVLSNGVGQWVPNDWRLLGVDPTDFFEFELYSSRTGLLKPDTRFFDQVAKQLQLPAKNLLMTGDSYEDDMLGAKYAGWSAAWISNEDFPQSKADWRISELKDLLKIKPMILEKLKEES